MSDIPTTIWTTCADPECHEWQTCTKVNACCLSQSKTTNEATWSVTVGKMADAVAWRDRHHEHVARLLASRENVLAYPPSGSDCRHPELWRAPHWRWLDMKSETAVLALSCFDLDMVRQWFNAVQDAAPRYLEQRDYELAARIHQTLGLPTPSSIMRHLEGAETHG